MTILFAALAVGPAAASPEGGHGAVPNPIVFPVVGPYRYVRNPMYVAVFTALVGEVIFLRSPWLVAWAAVVAGCAALAVGVGDVVVVELVVAVVEVAVAAVRGEGPVRADPHDTSTSAVMATQRTGHCTYVSVLL